MKKIFFQLIFAAVVSAGLMLTFSACQQEQIIDDLSTTITDNSEETDFRLPPLILADAILVDDGGCCTILNEERMTRVTLNPLTCSFYGNSLYYQFYNYDDFSNPIVLQASSLCEPEFCLPPGNYALLISPNSNCGLSYNGTTFSHNCKNSSPVYNVNVYDCPPPECGTPDVSAITWTYNNVSKSFTVCADAYNGVLHQFRYRSSEIGTTPTGNWIHFSPTTQSCNTFFEYKFSKCFYDVELSIDCGPFWTGWTQTKVDCASIGPG